MRCLVLVALGVTCGATVVRAQPPGAAGYLQPPPATREALDARPLPSYLLDPTNRTLAVIEARRLPPIDDLARPTLRMAGERIDAGSLGPLRTGHIESLKLRAALEPRAALREVRLPRPERAGEGSFYGFSWAPDGDRFVLQRRTSEGTELWAGTTASASVRRIDGLRLRAFLGEPIDWIGADSLLVLAVPLARGAPPAPPVSPGPVALESIGRTSQERTRQDLLRNSHDEALFEHYGSAQLILVDLKSGALRAVGRPAIYAQVEPLADGKHILAQRVVRPFSTQLGWEDFARVVEVIDFNGRVVRELARQPLRSNVPVGGVPQGARQFFASPAADATVYWVEALDGGNPRATAAARDRVLRLAPPFTGDPQEMWRLAHRLQRLWLLEDGTQALVEEFDRDRARLARRLVDLRSPNGPSRLLAERSMRERYNDPGTPLVRMLPNGRNAVRVANDHVLLTGVGGTPEGDRPFLDRLNLNTGEAVRVFRSDANAYESVLRVLDDDARRLLTQRESATEPPNLLLRDNGAPGVWLTAHADPVPALRKIKRELVRFKRADGVDLQFWLTLPSDYKPGERRPTLLWAYPQEFTDAATAGQVRGSPHRFLQLNGASPLYLALEGYVVLDDVTMPIVGDPDTVNNTFVEQVVASATAAIDKAAGIGVTDPARVAVGGHSYGAFMAANLLAATDLFKAGIAQSGAFNRTLTPFGFQGERRTLWEAREMYLRISPLLAADAIREPLLLVHGEADNNPGTFPLQSERLYQALAGTGGAVRYVSLPYEGHNYAARESVGHVLAEQNAWLRRYLGAPTP